MIDRGKNGHKGLKHTTETKMKISIAHKGKKFSEESRKKMSERMKKEWKENKPNGFKKGHKPKITDESRKKISEKVKAYWDKKGHKIYKRYHHICHTVNYKKWRMAVFIRDNFICQFCNLRGIYLEAHHIKSWSHYPNLRYKVDNGITLCKECHKLTR